MKLNCRQGDLAVVVRSQVGHQGKVVRVGRFVGCDAGMDGNDRWEIDRVLPGLFGTPAKTYRDSGLRPLRDSDGEDEMLRLVGLPNVGTPQAA